MLGEGVYQEFVRRGVVAAAIVGLHVVFALALIFGMLLQRGAPESPPLMVTFTEQPAAVEPRPVLEPRIVSVAPVSVALPDVPMSNDSETAITAVVAPQAPSVATVAAPDPQAGSGAPPALSAVDYLEAPTPHYPPESRRAREEGIVVLRVLIDESGRASSIDVYRSSGHRRLDEAACDAIRRALFKPYRDGGVARAAVAMVPVEFSLHG